MVVVLIVAVSEACQTSWKSGARGPVWSAVTVPSRDVAGAVAEVAAAEGLGADVGMTVNKGPRVEPVQRAPVTLTVVAVRTHVCANAWVHA